MTASGAPRRRRRTIFLKYKPDVSDALIRKNLEEIRENFSSMKGLQELEIGEQTNELSDFTHGISFVLEDEAALKVYRDDAQHKKLRERYIDIVERSQTTDIEAR